MKRAKQTKSLDPAGRVTPHRPSGAIVRTSHAAARKGRYAPRAQPAPSTTRQGEILNPALLGSGGDERGIPIGRDVISESAVFHDSFSAYQNGTITSPSVVVLGAIGSGKSSLLKTAYVLRPLIFNKRRVAVIDKKDEGGEGEYAELCRRFSKTEPFKFRIGGGGTVINPVDPTLRDILGAGRQLGLLKALTERAGGITLSSWQLEALRKAYAAGIGKADADRRTPLLSDVVDELGHIDRVDDWRWYSNPAKEMLHQSALEIRHLLGSTLAEDMAGVFDGPTSPYVRLNSKLTVFDVSQLPRESPVGAMVLAVAHAWLLGSLRKDRGQGTNFINEEGWDSVEGPVADQMNANQMLARGLGICNVTALHHISQVPPESKAWSLLREPQTVHIYRQDRDDDARACVQMYGLEEGSEDLLRNLANGSHLLKIGNQPEIQVEHVRTSIEYALTNTDKAMLLREGGRDGQPTEGPKA